MIYIIVLAIGLFAIGVVVGSTKARREKKDLIKALTHYASKSGS
jgi:hypothetical protein